MRRHANTWLAFTPCLRATSATDAPGFNVSSTIWRRSCLERNNRVRPLFNVTNFSADCTAPIIPPLGIASPTVKDGGTNPESLHVTHRTVTLFLKLQKLIKPRDVLPQELSTLLLKFLECPAIEYVARNESSESVPSSCGRCEYVDLP